MEDNNAPVKNEVNAQASLSGWKGLHRRWSWGQTYPCQDKQLQRSLERNRALLHCCSN